MVEHLSLKPTQRQPYAFEKALAERRPASTAEEAIARGVKSLAEDLETTQKQRLSPKKSNLPITFNV